jgi:hypothetical protein
VRTDEGGYGEKGDQCRHDIGQGSTDPIGGQDLGQELPAEEELNSHAGAGPQLEGRRHRELQWRSFSDEAQGAGEDAGQPSKRVVLRLAPYVVDRRPPRLHYWERTGALSLAPRKIPRHSDVP